MSEKLMDYYQKWASTHATIIVAVIFGLFSLLTLSWHIGRELSFSLLSITFISLELQNFSIPILIMLYAALGLFGAYEIDRWKWYSDQAKEIAKFFGSKEHGWEKKRFTWVVTKFFELIKWLFAIFVICAFFGVLLSL